MVHRGQSFLQQIKHKHPQNFETLQTFSCQERVPKQKPTRPIFELPSKRKKTRRSFSCGTSFYPCDTSDATKWVAGHHVWTQTALTASAGSVCNTSCLEWRSKSRATKPAPASRCLQSTIHVLQLIGRFGHIARGKFEPAMCKLHALNKKHSATDISWAAI